MWRSHPLVLKIIKQNFICPNLLAFILIVSNINQLLLTVCGVIKAPPHMVSSIPTHVIMWFPSINSGGSELRDVSQLSWWLRGEPAERPGFQAMEPCRVSPERPKGFIFLKAILFIYLVCLCLSVCLWLYVCLSGVCVCVLSVCLLACLSDYLWFCVVSISLCA